jgi:hypothetical protein
MEVREVAPSVPKQITAFIEICGNWMIISAFD